MSEPAFFAAAPAPEIDASHGPPPSFNWVYRDQNKRQRVEDGTTEDDTTVHHGFVNLQLNDDDKAPLPDDDDDDVAGLVQLPDAVTTDYCYLCEVSSAPDRPDVCRDRMLKFLRTQSREIDPELLCQCAVVFYNNSVAAELIAGDPTSRPRKFTAAMVYTHMTRHMLDPAFTSGRIIRVLMAYDDLCTRTMRKTAPDGSELPPDKDAAKTHLKVLSDLSREIRLWARNGTV